MSRPEPSFSVNVDVANPGQFFACCGLLELAHRLWPGAEGWFDRDVFSVAGCRTLSEIMKAAKGSSVQADTTRGVNSIHPIQIGFHKHGVGIALDWWLMPDWHRHRKAPKKMQVSLMSSSFKLWAGQQTSLKIVEGLKGELPDGELVNLFECAQPMTGRFGVDPRAAWNALDVGFSPNEQQMTVETSPVVELLAAIGLQRFRPTTDMQGGHCYATWSVPLTAPVAAAAAVAIVPAGEIHMYRFQLADRGSYKCFDPSVPVGGNT